MTSWRAPDVSTIKAGDLVPGLEVVERDGFLLKISDVRSSGRYVWVSFATIVGPGPTPGPLRLKVDSIVRVLRPMCEACGITRATDWISVSGGGGFDHVCNGCAAANAEDRGSDATS